MDESPVVDIVLATNRESPYLSDAIGTVRSQTWTNWRLIVVDDGVPSPAFVPTTLAGCPNATAIRTDPRGVSAARNTGYASGSGDLLVFLDDDDVWEPTRLERQVQALKAVPSCVGAYTSGWYMSADGTPFEDGDGWSVQPTSAATLLAGERPLPRITTLMVRREVCERLGGFDPELALAEDIDFIIRLLLEGELVAVPQRLVGYRRHDSNATNAPLARQHRATDRVLSRQIRAALQRGDVEVVRLLETSRQHYRAVAAHECPARLAAELRQGGIREGMLDLLWSTWTSPRTLFRAIRSALQRRRSTAR